MGTNNKARRAAKARRRAKQVAQRRAGLQQGPAPHGSGNGPDDTAHARGVPTDMWAEHEDDLHRILVAIWAGGWQPAELIREVQRSTKRPKAVELVRRLIAVDHARRLPQTLHPLWQAQVDSLGLTDTRAGAGWLADELRRSSQDHAADLRILLLTLQMLGPLPRLIPPPGGSATDVDIAQADNNSQQSDPVLERVRALLAQAESTNYPAEAEAFTAKAHELMTRHAIDAALIEGTTTSAGWATAVRIAVDDPYVETKSLLLHIVAKNSRCRAVFHGRYAVSTVIGTSDDLAAVQLLFTSLLLQAQQALLAEGDAVQAGARQRSRAYRTSFLFAYANRIGERLAEVSASTAADVESTTGASVLPVLAQRLEVLDRTIEDLFGPLTHSRVSAGRDPVGWDSGRRAADRAHLGDADLAAGGQQPLALAG